MGKQKAIPEAEKLAPAAKTGRFKRHWPTILLTAVLLTGLGLILYPSFADYWNSFHQSRAIMSYTAQVAEMDPKICETMFESAQAYNAALAERGIRWSLPEADQTVYRAELNFDTEGIMGHIRIPKIDVELPIYHGTQEAVLQTAIGHLEGSSLPVGGPGTHALLSGHRGLPSAKLFTDLDRLSEGDIFTISVLNRTLTYEVDRILVVEPTDLSSLSIEAEQDYCTLITCTPYGINTHRLLVRGHRVITADADVNVPADAIQIRPIYITPFLAVPVIVILVAVVLIGTGPRRRKAHTNVFRNRG